MKRLLLLVGVWLSACGGAPEVQQLSGPQIDASSAADPALTIDPRNGDVLMSWVEGDSAGYYLKFARSRDGGVSWSTPVSVVAQPGEVKPHAEASPRLVATHAVIGVFWPRQQHIEGRRFPASDMRFARSTDGGTTWSAPITLNDDTTGTPSGHTFHGATAVDDSTLVVAWLDSRAVVEQAHGGDLVHHEGSSFVFATTSHDGGATWDAANRRYWGQACPCCRVALAPFQGEIMAAWRGHFDNDVRDVVTASLTDPGAQPERVHADDWSFPGCPHSGPGLTAAGDELHITWFTGAPAHAGVYYKRLDADAAPTRVLGGEHLPAAHPVVAAVADGVIIAINLAASGERVLTIAHVDGERVRTTVVPQSNGADHPQIITLTNDAALVAWTEKGARDAVRLARVRVP